LGTKPKNGFFHHLAPDFDEFLPHAECAVNKINLSMSKLKVGGGCFSAHMYAYNINHSVIAKISKICQPALPPTQYAWNNF
jgi:hypothetical protein